MPDLSMLTRKVGPFPVVVYPIIGGGVLLLLKRVGTPSASTANAATNTVPDSGVQNGVQLQSPIPVGAGNSIYDPNTGNTSTAPVQPSIIGTGGAGFLSSLGDFLGGLTNAPNSVSVSDANGGNLTFGNGTPTYGNGANLHSVQEDANAWNYDLGMQGLHDNFALSQQDQLNTYATGVWRMDNALATPALTSGNPPPSTSVPTTNAPSQWANLRVFPGPGNFAAISQQCPPGNMECARYVAPWYAGQKIAGWN